MAEATLRELYYSLDQPSALSGVDRLFKHAKRIHPNLQRKDVEEWLQGQDTYTLYRPAARRLRASPRVFVKHIDDQWGIDLCDMQDVARSNDGYRYILTCIDVFSKYAWAVPVAKKYGNTVAAAFAQILRSTNRRPKRIESDQGKEFYSQPFQQSLVDSNIEHFSSNSRHKCSVVERFNRTLKTLIYRSFEARNTLKWVDALQPLLNVYNGRYHRSIRMAPNDVSKENEQDVYSYLYSKPLKSGKLLEIGQLVRISKIKRTFEKGYYPNYTDEVFRIIKIHKKKPYQYGLEDLMNDPVEGKFVAEELTVVKKPPDTLWRVEKVLKRDRHGYFVKWYGFPDKFNSYVESIDVL